MIRIKRVSIVAITLVCLALVGCDAFQIPTPAPTAQPTPSGTPTGEPSGQPTLTPVPTEAPTPTPTEVPTPTPSPTPTPTPVPTPTPTAANGWAAPALIDTGLYFYLSAVTDAQGHTHIAASDRNSVYYLSDASGAWTRTQLSQAPTGGADIEPVIAIAPDGTLAVAFTRWSIWTGCVACPTIGEIEGVFFASNGGNGWSDPRQVPGFGQQPALAFWNDSWSIIAKQHDGLFWYRKDGVEWPDRKIGDEDASPGQIAVDGDGVAHVVYSTPKNLIHVTRNGKLEDQPVPNSGGAERPLLAVDSQGSVQLVYTGGVGQILHRVLVADEWSGAEQLDVDGADSFEVDAAGNLHVLYLRRHADTGNSDVVYASIVNRVGQVVELGTIYFLEQQPSGAATMALDDEGRPHVVFSTLGEGSTTYMSLGPAL